MTLDFAIVSKAAELRARWRSREHTDRGLVGALVILDAALVVLATLAAAFGRNNLTLFEESAADLNQLVAPVAVVLVLAWMLGLVVAGSYRVRRIGAGTSEYRSIFVASLLTAGVLGTLGYLTQYPLSRGFFVLLFCIGIPFLLAGRALARLMLHSLRRSGAFRIPTLVAGSVEHVDDVSAVLARESWLGYEVVGALVREAEVDATPSGIPVAGSPDDTLTALGKTGATTVIFAEGSFPRAHGFNAMARELEAENAHMIVVPALSDISADRLHVRPVAGLPLVHVEQPTAQKSGRWFKRAFDAVCSTVLIVLLAPVMAAVALAVKLSDPGPALFRQIRVGTKGDLFTCFKFRSMYHDAEDRLVTLHQQTDTDGVLFKMRSDPRITPVGRFIRRYSLDELPQLFNVLKGQMSLVGPRPALPTEVSLYEDHVHRRLDVRPGMTGLWQVSGRSDLPWEDTVRLDLYYVDNWSMLRDLVILLRTFGAVIGSRGAY